MAERPDLDEDKGGKLIDPIRFRGMVGSLMYLSASRPDIVFAVCMCARNHHMGLWYPKDSGFELKAFADADYARCHDTRRSTSGSAQILGHQLVSWSSKSRKVPPSPLQRLNTSPYQDVVLKSSGCALNYETMDLRSTKFRCIMTIKVLLLYAVIVFNTRVPSTLIFVTTLSKSRLKGKLLSCISWRQNTTAWTIFSKAFAERALRNTTPTAWS
ncbi:hypothetical protein Tco_0805984 [Tanacetum coccineum]